MWFYGQGRMNGWSDEPVLASGSFKVVEYAEVDNTSVVGSQGEDKGLK